MRNIIIISAPSGTGKTTLCKAIQEKIVDIQWSVSFTTRKKRAIEIDGIDYKFISEKNFKKLIAENKFSEWEKVHGNYYGTSKISLFMDRIAKLFKKPKPFLNNISWANSCSEPEKPALLVNLPNRFGS